MNWRKELLDIVKEAAQTTFGKVDSVVRKTSFQYSVSVGLVREAPAGELIDVTFMINILVSKELSDAELDDFYGKISEFFNQLCLRGINRGRRTHQIDYAFGEKLGVTGATITLTIKGLEKGG